MSQSPELTFTQQDRLVFISDLHLHESRSDLSEAFQRFISDLAESNLSNTSEKLFLFILGDFFEAWIGDDHKTDLIRQTFSCLNNLAKQGVQIYFMHGNRDFLVGKSACEQANMKLLPEPTVIEVDQERIVILHGDSLCTDDTEYMVFRNTVRHPAWQHTFLEKSIDERKAIARSLRDKSKSLSKEKSLEITDVNLLEVDRVMQDSDCDLMIHGHTHRPKTHNNIDTDGRKTRIVLGDWNKLGWALTLHKGEQNLYSFPV